MTVPDLLSIPPSAATRAVDRIHETRGTQDWDGLEALFAPTRVLDDRRRAFRASGGLQMDIENVRHAVSSGFPAPTLLATLFDRFALYRTFWRGSENELTLGVNALELAEVDAGGRIIALIVFDLDDRRAATGEMAERAARSEMGRQYPDFWEFGRAMLDHDLSRLRAAIPNDFVFHDHRRTGAGRLEGADQFVGWIRSLFDESRDAMAEILYTTAAAPYGMLNVARTFGTLSEGGEFEFVYVHLSRFKNGRLVALDLFEVENMDVARAQFEALGARSVPDPPAT